MTASEAMVHPFFDELRNPETKMANGRDLPELFNFTREGKKDKKKATSSYTRLLLELSVRPDLIHKLVPAYCKENLLQSGIDIDNFIPIPLKDLRLNIVD